MLEKKSLEPKEELIPRKFFLLLIAGLIILFTGVLIITASTAFYGGNGSASTGIVIFIGPFPIVFGTGSDAEWLILIGLIIGITCIAVFVATRKKWISNYSQS